MNDLLKDPKLAYGIITLCIGVIIVLFRREVKRIDTMLADSVRRSEFDQLRKDMDTRHHENIDRLERIEDVSTGTHRRIDEFLLQLPGMLKK